ncbi:hypothetical protein N9C31_02540 [Gammaproteobacteria bacterium]|nr:hypothetical protein [Gammaproteobacteria bacterium]
MIDVYVVTINFPWRALCQKILTHHHIHPHSLYKDSRGKPQIKNQPGFISWAHSKKHVVIAFSKTHAVGADCEDMRPIPFKAIQNRYFPDEPAITNDSDFFKKWTEKEALCKLKGTTIWRELPMTRHGSVTHKVIGQCVFCIATHQPVPIMWVAHCEIEKWFQMNQ